MKRIGLLCLLVGFLVTSAYASSSATATGSWSDTSVWLGNVVPPLNSEIKINGADGITVTVDSACGAYVSKLGIARDNIVEVASGSISFARDIKIGDNGSSSSGTDIGYLNVSGGSITATASNAPICVGYGGGTTPGYGYMTVTAGSVSGVNMKVGCEGNGSDGVVGKLTIDSTTATIVLTGTLFVANESSSTAADSGTATVEFDLNGDNVSIIQALDVAIDSMNEWEAIADLVVVAGSTTPTADVIVLIESTGAGAVVGYFDTISNGTTSYWGDEGGFVELGTDNWYQLTYLYDQTDDDNNNDIALVRVPEPATLILLAIGGLIATKRRK